MTCAPILNSMSFSCIGLHQDQQLFFSVSCVTFFGMLKVFEYTCPMPFAYNGSRDLSFNDISFTNSTVSICIKFSKTNQTGSSAAAAGISNATVQILGRWSGSGSSHIYFLCFTCLVTNDAVGSWDGAWLVAPLYDSLYIAQQIICYLLFSFSSFHKYGMTS